MILKQCDILLIQETWVKLINISLNIIHMEFLVSKTTFYLQVVHMAGAHFYTKKSLPAKTEFMTMDSDRMCCVRLSTNVGFIYVSMYIFHVTTPHNVTYSCTMKCWQHYQVFSLNIML